MKALTIVEAYHIVRAEEVKESKEYHKAIYQAKLELRRQKIAELGFQSTIVAEVQS